MTDREWAQKEVEKRWVYANRRNSKSLVDYKDIKLFVFPVDVWGWTKERVKLYNEMAYKWALTQWSKT